MLANDDPERTLARAFFDSFRTSTGGEPPIVAETLERFYRETYPSLRTLTRPKAGATDLLQTAKARGLSVAVATNPLMIRPAIEQRLSWAGVPSDRFEYAIITDVETLHFAKPRPAYVAETLAYLGLLPSEAVMIGNEIGDDLEPAAALGLPTFHVTTAPDADRPSGDLAAAAQWLIEQTELDAPPVHLPGALLARLEGQLAALLTRLALLGEETLRIAPSTGTLAPLQVVCHLRDVEREVNLPRLEVFLSEEEPFFSSVDTDAWVEERAYLREDPATAIEGLVTARRRVTETLRRLEPSQWQRRARHSILGRMTLAEWMAVVVEHDLRHQAQVIAPLGSRRSPVTIH
jgi:FMN phosphatase YigB (HAD superfamily)